MLTLTRGIIFVRKKKFFFTKHCVNVFYVCKHFLTTATTNYHKINGLKQYKCMTHSSTGLIFGMAS